MAGPRVRRASHHGLERTVLLNYFEADSADASQCLDRNLVAVGLNTAGTGRQGDRPNPTNAQCGAIPGFRLNEFTCGSPVELRRPLSKPNESLLTLCIRVSADDRVQLAL